MLATTPSHSARRARLVGSLATPFALALAGCSGGGEVGADVAPSADGGPADVSSDGASAESSGDAASLDDAASDAPDGGDGAWRSALYPEAWTPDFTGGAGQFLHDFSYAGYHRSEIALPSDWPGITADVTAYGAHAGGVDDSAPGFAAAIAAVAAAGGGVVYVPDGEYLLASPIVVRASRVLLRGQSRAGTRLRFPSLVGGSASLRFVGAAEPTVGRVALAADGVARSREVRVADASAFHVGDDVLVDFVITQAFVDEHAMGGLWDTGANSAVGARKVFFRRTITAVDATLALARITLDVPLRYPTKVRDDASIRVDTGAISECGLEHLSVDDVVSTSDALADPRAHAISFERAQDCFARDVGTYATASDATHHLRSGGIYVGASKRVTVASSAMEHAQNHGDGGAGYAFEASASSEVLFVDDRASDVRHGFIQNWDFGSSGLVFLRCDAEGDTAVNSGFSMSGTSEFHHRLAMASLYDGCHDSSGFNAFNRGADSSNAGHAATQNVFWNVSGSGAASRLRSYQAGDGYVIGTRDLTVRVVADLLDHALGYDLGTEPTDHLEGQDRGAGLEPASLFDDQLARRLGR